MTPGDGQSPTWPPALAAALALGVGALAAVGLTGDSLLRAVRNSPFLIAFSLVLALVGAAVFVMAKQSGFKMAGLVASIVAAAALIGLGAWAVWNQEIPLVSVQAGPVTAPPSAAPSAFKNGNIEVTVGARAAGLETTDSLIVQVIGIESYTGVSQSAVELCENKDYSWSTGETNATPGPNAKQGSLLMWTRVGPAANGTVDTTWKFQIEAGDYQGLCATIIGSQNSAAYLRLR